MKQLWKLEGVSKRPTGLRGACPVSFSHHANLSWPKHPVMQFVASLLAQTGSMRRQAEALHSILMER